MKRLILTSLCLLFARGAFAWGQKGHDVTAYIAETDGVIPFLDVGARQEDHFQATYDDLSSIVE